MTSQDESEVFRNKRAELEELANHYQWNLTYEEDDRRAVAYWHNERLKKYRGLQKFYISFWKYSFPWSTLRSFIKNFNFMVIIQMVIAGLAVWACNYWNIAFNFHISLFVSPIVFPLAFSINTDFQRREKVLHDLGDFKSSALTWFFCMREWRETAEKDKEWLEDIKKKLRSIMFMLTEYLLTEQVNLRDIYARYIYEDLSDISQLNEQIRSSPLPANTAIVSRVYHLLNTLNSSFESLRVVREYRSPRSIRSFNKVLILLLPILLCPYFVHIGRDKDVIAWGPYTLAVIVAGVFGALQCVQDKLDNPFDGLGEDDINLDTMYEWATDSLKTAADRTIIGRFKITRAEETNLDREKSRSHADLIRDALTEEITEDKSFPVKLSPFLNCKRKSVGEDGDSSQDLETNRVKSESNKGFEDSCDKIDSMNKSKRYSINSMDSDNCERRDRSFRLSKLPFNFGFKRNDESSSKQSSIKKRVSFKTVNEHICENESSVKHLPAHNDRSRLALIQRELERELKKKKKKKTNRRRRGKKKKSADGKILSGLQNDEHKKLMNACNPEVVTASATTTDVLSRRSKFYTDFPSESLVDVGDNVFEEQIEPIITKKIFGISSESTSISSNGKEIEDMHTRPNIVDETKKNEPSLTVTTEKTFKSDANARNILNTSVNKEETKPPKNMDSSIRNPSENGTKSIQIEQIKLESNSDQLKEIVVHKSQLNHSTNVLT